MRAEALGEGASPRGRLRHDDGCHAPLHERGDGPEADGPRPDDDGAGAGLGRGPSDVPEADGERLGERGDMRRHVVGHGDQRGLLQHDALPEAAREGGGVSDGAQGAAPVEHPWQPDDDLALPLPGAEHPRAQLVPHDQIGVRVEQERLGAGVAGRAQEGVGVAGGGQVGAADAGGERLGEDLARACHGLGHLVLDEPAAAQDGGPHRTSPPPRTAASTALRIAPTNRSLFSWAQAADAVRRRFAPVQCGTTCSANSS